MGCVDCLLCRVYIPNPLKYEGTIHFVRALQCRRVCSRCSWVVGNRTRHLALTDDHLLLCERCRDLVGLLVHWQMEDLHWNTIILLVYGVVNEP